MARLIVLVVLVLCSCAYAADDPCADYADQVVRERVESQERSEAITQKWIDDGEKEEDQELMRRLVEATEEEK